MAAKKKTAPKKATTKKKAPVKRTSKKKAPATPKPVESFDNSEERHSEGKAITSGVFIIVGIIAALILILTQMQVASMEQENIDTNEEKFIGWFWCPHRKDFFRWSAVVDCDDVVTYFML